MWSTQFSDRRLGLASCFDGADDALNGCSCLMLSIKADGQWRGAGGFSATDTSRDTTNGTALAEEGVDLIVNFIPYLGFCL